jgi:hypothetical protein
MLAARAASRPRDPVQSRNPSEEGEFSMERPKLSGQ